MQLRMESETSSIALMNSDFKMFRIGSYAMVAAFGFGLVTRLSFVIPQWVSRSPMALADIAYTFASSIFLFGALYTLTPRYQGALRPRWKESYRKSGAEQFRKVLLGVLGALGLTAIMVLGMIFIEIARSPGQDMGAYFVDAGPLAVLNLAIVFVAIVVWTSIKPLERRIASRGPRFTL